MLKENKNFSRWSSYIKNPEWGVYGCDIGTHILFRTFTCTSDCSSRLTSYF